ALFHRDHPGDVQKIQRKLGSAQKSIKQQLEHEQRQTAILHAKAKELEEELRQAEEADKEAQIKLQRLQEKAAAAAIDLNSKLSHPFTPIDIDVQPFNSLEDIEMQRDLDDFDLSPQDLGLSADDLKPEAARIIDTEEIRKVFDALANEGTGLISREKFQETCVQLWKLDCGKDIDERCPKANQILRKMFLALEQAAQASLYLLVALSFQ
ncbi:MAG: hypothetical protein SGPRY_003790, partial [Prymnesium sp.]